MREKWLLKNNFCWQGYLQLEGKLILRSHRPDVEGILEFRAGLNSVKISENSNSTKPQNK